MPYMSMTSPLWAVFSRVLGQHPVAFMALVGLEGFAKLIRAFYRFMSALLSGGVSTLE